MAEKSGKKAVIDVGGLGLEVQLSRKAESLCVEGQEVTLHSNLILSEAGPSLFGFGDELEKAVFLRLTSVRGIGGKLALQILQSMPAERVVEAVSLGDPRSLTSVPGIGKKTAERICFELQEKMKIGLPVSLAQGSPDQGSSMSTVLEAIESLGFGPKEAEEAVNSLSKEMGSIENIGLEELIMLVLKRLNHKS